MKDKITHSGSGIISREYEVRELDADGECEEVNHYPNKREAIKGAKEALARGVNAAVVELHTTKSPMHLFNEPNKYETIAAGGDKAALAEWGWEPGDGEWINKVIEKGA